VAQQNKRVLIVSPHFPPINAPDHQRVRTALPYLSDFGWDATVLAVDPNQVEGLLDPLLAKTVPSTAPVIRTAALPVRWTRLLGLGSLALRALPFLWAAGRKRLRQKPEFDLVFFSTTLFPILILGPLWKRKFRTPYVVDYQDPWSGDHYNRGGAKPPGGRFKYRVTRWLARLLEAPVVRSAARFVIVSPAYAVNLCGKYPFLKRDQFTALPFGAPERDFQFLDGLKQEEAAGRVAPGRIVYVGAAGPFMAPSLRLLFSAVKASRAREPQKWQELRFAFIGTSYAPAGKGQRVVEPIATELGVQDLVEEETGRISYFEALATLRSSDGLLILGSDSPSYSPSKVYPYVLARRPTLAILHAESPAAGVVSKCRAGTLVTYSGSGHLADDFMERALDRFLHDIKENVTPDVDWPLFAEYSAREMTKKLCGVFDHAVSRETGI
jgi:hypothetical protein